MEKYGFGVDIGGTTIKMSLFEMVGEIVDKWEIPTNTADHGSSILDDVAAAIEGCLTEWKIEKEDVAGIGIGVPGPVLENAVVMKCVNLGWGRVDVARVLGEKTGLKVRVGNDANVAALGEMWQGGGKGNKNVVMVTLGTGGGGGKAAVHALRPGGPRRGAAPRGVHPPPPAIQIPEPLYFIWQNIWLL